MKLLSIATYVLAIDAAVIAFSALSNGLDATVETVSSETVEPGILLVLGLVLVGAGPLVRAYSSFGSSKR